MVKKYMCVGEKYIDQYPLGFCGETKTLTDWVDTFFGKKGLAYFEGASDGEVIEYIKQIAGKRLEVFK